MSESNSGFNAVKMFQDKVDVALSKIQTLEQFRESDKMVDFVLRVGKELFEVPLDQMGIDRLLSQGGKLVGAYPYLGQKMSYARAVRDVYEQKLKETEKELFLSYIGDKYKVTEVKAIVSGEVEILSSFVLQKESEKNAWENITTACGSMVMFCQSALRIKEAERFSSNRMQSQ